MATLVTTLATLMTFATSATSATFATLVIVEPHVHRIGALGLHGAVDNTFRRQVVSLDQRRWLAVSHALQYQLDVHSFLCIDI